MSGTSRANAPPAGGASGIGAQWQQALRWVPVTGFVVALAALGVVPAAAAQPPGDAAANLAGDGKLESALALLDTWVADNPDDPRMFPVLLQVVTAAPRKLTVDAVVERYRGRLATDQIAVLRAAPADLAELSGGVVQALRALELSGIADAPKRRAALMLELGEVTLDTVPDGMPIVHAGLARSGEGLGQARLEPSLRAAFQGSDTQADGGAVGAVAGYGLVSLLAANGRAAEAAAILEQMRSRFPRSPEYALAAAELNAGAGLPRVVAFPSPAMLLGALVASCLPPCPPPAAVLLAGPVERGETQTVPTATPDTGLMAALAAPPEAEPAAVVAAPAAKPVVDLMVAPTVEPAVVVTRAAEPAVAVVTPEPRPAVAAPAAKSVAVVVTRAAEPAVAVAGGEAGAGCHDSCGKRNRVRGDTGTGSSCRNSRCVARSGRAVAAGGPQRRYRPAGAGLVAAGAPDSRRHGKHRGNDLQAPLGPAGSYDHDAAAGDYRGIAARTRGDRRRPGGAGFVAAGSGSVHRSDRSLPGCGQRSGVGAPAHRGRVPRGGALLPRRWRRHRPSRGGRRQHDADQGRATAGPHSRSRILRHHCAARRRLVPAAATSHAVTGRRGEPVSARSRTTA